jgi:DNA-binding CsgD family transcriptional regulator
MELGEHRNGKWVSGSIAFWLWKSGELEAVPEWVADPWYLSTTNEWLAAARIWADLGCPYEQALALTQGDAAARLEALDIVDRLGATAVAAKLRKSMREDGITVPRRRPARAKRGSGLTPRQEEVLLLLNEHLTNAEIADQLFLSPRTVEHHVAAVISKLDASSRDNAVEIATERGLLAGV